MGRFLSKCVSALLKGLWFVCRALAVLWGTLAIYYSNLPWATARIALAAIFAVVMVWALWYSQRRHMTAFAAVLFLCVVAWWISISPRDDRNWRPDVAVMPRATIEGDRVRLSGFRNFDYRSLTDFTIRHEEREVQLSHLTGLDFYISFFTEGPVGHTFVSFIFDNAPPVSISIEARPEVGRQFSPIPSLFKQFELIYVVGDERDIVRQRTNFRGEPVYLYHLNTSPEDARRLFLVYLGRVNQLAERPEFYNLLTNNCTINIVRHANAAGRSGRFSFRHLLNGLIDVYLYASGRMASDLPFDELRRRSRINEAAMAADDAPDFSQRIRVGLPGGPR